MQANCYEEKEQRTIDSEANQIGYLNKCHLYDVSQKSGLIPWQTWSEQIGIKLLKMKSKQNSADFDLHQIKRMINESHIELPQRYPTIANRSWCYNRQIKNDQLWKFEKKVPQSSTMNISVSYKSKWFFSFVWIKKIFDENWFRIISVAPFHRIYYMHRRFAIAFEETPRLDAAANMLKLLCIPRKNSQKFETLQKRLFPNRSTDMPRNI